MRKLKLNFDTIILVENLHNFAESLKQIANTNLKDVRSVKRNALFLEDIILHLNKKELTEIKKTLQKLHIFYKLQVLYETFETNLEYEFATAVIKGKKNVRDYLLTKRFITLIKNEISLGKITKNDKVLFIGSGPFPISPILFNHFTGCHVDCYEKVKDRVEISNKALSKLGLSNLIEAFYKKGEEISSNKYNVIIIALLAKPKDRILKKILVTVNPGTKSISRPAESVNNVYYEETDNKLLKGYKIVKKKFGRIFGN